MSNMTPRKALNPDAIAVEEAARITNLKPSVLRRLRREGLLSRLPGRTTYSRQEAHALAADPWITGREVAEILSISHERVSQLAKRERIPVHVGVSGRRFYRRSLIVLVSNARRARASQESSQVAADG